MTKKTEMKTQQPTNQTKVELGPNMVLKTVPVTTAKTTTSLRKKDVKRLMMMMTY